MPTTLTSLPGRGTVARYLRPLCGPAAWLLAGAAPLAAAAQGPTTTQNFVLTTTVLVPGKTSAAAVQGMPSFNATTGAVERQQQLTYFDGLGRPVQQVQVQASPGKQDMVVPIVYDALGRTPTSYLPYTGTGGGGGSFQPGALTQQAAFYQPNGRLDHVVNDAVPSARNLYEASPLGRVLEQGAPGTAWQPGTRHTVKLNQRANLADEVRQWTYDEAASPVCSSPGTYPAGTLVASETRDEQGGLVTEFTDRQGRLVLRKVAGTGTACGLQPEGGTLVFNAPAGMGFIGIRSATWGGLLQGTTCDDAQFDLAHRADATSYVQALVAAQLRMYPAPATISLPVDYQTLGPDPYPGVGKSLLVEAIYAPASTPTNTDLCTYYVYDFLDNLRLVLQPEGCAGYSTTAPSTVISLSADFLQTWCFRYDYDGRRRMVRKQVPGAGEQRFVYNQRNQVVLSQDANQAALGPPQWTFIKYDGLNRPIMTGFVALPPETQASLQALYDTETVLTETPDLTSAVGYSLQNSFPRWTGWGHQPVTADNLLTLTYYDNYDFPRLQNGQLASTLPGAQRLSRASGLVTGSSARTLGPGGPTGQWLTTATYFDQSYRPLQTLAQNQLGGVTTSTSTYDFTRLLSTSTTQTTSAGQAFSQTNRFTYGPGNRLETTYQNTAGQGEIILSHQTYNELGQLIAKRLHNDQPPVPPAAPTSTKYLQKVDYRYNIRGWLTHLNNRDLDNNSIEDSPGVYVADPETADAEPDLFGLELRYDNMLHGGATAQFNGNIAQQLWQTRSPDPNRTQNNVLRTYNYSYDGLSRITGAEYKVWDGVYWNASPALNFSVAGITYDYNGNIKTLNRRGTTSSAGAAPTSGWLDQLKYTYGYYSNGKQYMGNKLLAVDDAAPANGASHDFKDGRVFTSNFLSEYAYDANGNLLSDANKQVSGISYSMLNQPTLVSLGANRIEYAYSATGTKLQKRVYTAGTLSETTDYVGPVVYQTLPGNTPQALFAHSAEGRVLNLGSSNSPYGWKYEYHLKDHLGNLRLAFRADRDNGATTQVVGMEPANATREERTATHVAETRLADPSRARTGSYVARLNAGTGRRQGPSLRLAVRAGDSIRAEVYGRYDRGATTGQQAARTALALGAATRVQPAPTGPEQFLAAAPRRTWRPFVGLSMGVVPHLLKLKRARLPVAYLRYELFTKDSQLVATKTQPLQRTATDSWQQLVAGTRADSAGFVHISLLNESKDPAYFDDLAARTVAPVPYQENHYDPFGLNLVGIETTGSPNAQYQYNSKEKQENFGLNWTDYGARMYDAALGRFSTMDRFADKYAALSPYQYGANNPLSNIDINGDSLWITFGAGKKAQTLLYDEGHLLNKDGSAYGGKVNGFLKSTFDALNTIGKSKQGVAMLSDLQTSTNNFTIKSGKSEFQESNPYRAHANQWQNDPALAQGMAAVLQAGKDFQGGSGGIIYWNAAGAILPTTAGGSTNPVTDLAHEMFHAMDANHGLLDVRVEDGYKRSEWQAVYRENVLRSELNQPLRTNYTTVTDPSGTFVRGQGASMLTSTNQPLLPTWYVWFK